MDLNQSLQIDSITQSKFSLKNFKQLNHGLSSYGTVPMVYFTLKNQKIRKLWFFSPSIKTHTDEPVTTVDGAYAEWTDDVCEVSMLQGDSTFSRIRWHHFLSRHLNPANRWNDTYMDFKCKYLRRFLTHTPRLHHILSPRISIKLYICAPIGR